MANIGRYKFDVLPRDVDFFKRITIISLGDYILHTAGENADTNGFGMKQLWDMGCAWVLSRFSVEMTSTPQQYEQIEIETWVEEVGRLMTTRNFVIYNSKGDVIGGAVSQWVMIDFASRKPKDLGTVLDYNGYVLEQKGVVAKPARLKAIDGEHVADHTVRYSDIDFNRHANSMKYVEWVVDTLPLDSFDGGGVKRLDINFLHEAVWGDKISIYSASTDGGVGFELRDTQECALCRILLQVH